ncbi:hypothetical protein AC626_21200 [Pseudoalteromonas rubra]|uniref:Uncharacterized protein n=1 Tax=Pseudoalteromonas rubra TaxID=43658 RepID=A0A0L0EMQ0_9GAMM|nr:hypothetical protein AC626_21200 [Pseudoalteromonas rubra]
MGKPISIKSDGIFLSLFGLTQLILTTDVICRHRYFVQVGCEGDMTTVQRYQADLQRKAYRIQCGQVQALEGVVCVDRLKTVVFTLIIIIMAAILSGNRVKLGFLAVG